MSADESLDVVERGVDLVQTNIGGPKIFFEKAQTSPVVEKSLPKNLISRKLWMSSPKISQPFNLISKFRKNLQLSLNVDLVFFAEVLAPQSWSCATLAHYNSILDTGDYRSAILDPILLGNLSTQGCPNSILQHLIIFIGFHSLLALIDGANNLDLNPRNFVFLISWDRIDQGFLGSRSLAARLIAECLTRALPRVLDKNGCRHCFQNSEKSGGKSFRTSKKKYKNQFGTNLTYF